mmetsp:Transcript_3799/g.9009  ORF Transcript_3799/g.9009 Transcript_3799/m.9009 type:complete len:335 (+) Transcript_3799:133-1137(+)
MWAPVNRKGTVLLDFTPPARARDALPLTKGQSVSVFSKQDGWFKGLATVSGEKKRGIFPESYVVLADVLTEKESKNNMLVTCAASSAHALPVRRVKVFCGDKKEIRRLRVASYQDLVRRIAKGPIRVKYRDDEGDLVTISSDREFVDAFAIIGEGSVLKLFVERETPWIRLYDEGTECMYYYNAETKESTWEEPPEGFLTDEAAAKHDNLKALSEGQDGRQRHDLDSKDDDRQLRFASIPGKSGEFEKLFAGFLREPELIQLFESNMKTLLASVQDSKEFLTHLKKQIDRIPALVKHPFYQLVHPNFDTFTDAVASQMKTSLTVVAAKLLSPGS